MQHDSLWFAVDTDGFIAAFYSCEGQPIPIPCPDEMAITREGEQIKRGDDVDRGDLEIEFLLQWLTLERIKGYLWPSIKALPESCDLTFDVDACFHFANFIWFGEIAVRIPRHTQTGDRLSVVRDCSSELFTERALGPVLAFITDLEIVRDDLAQGVATLPNQFGAGGQAIVRFNDLSGSRAQRLLASGVCTCLVTDPPEDAAFSFWDLKSMLGKRGIFFYSGEDFADVDFFCRDVLPTMPVNIHDLPANLHSHLLRNTMRNVSFAQCRFLQPELHLVTTADDSGKRYFECNGTPTEAFESDDLLVAAREGFLLQRDEERIDIIRSAKIPNDQSL